MTREEAKEFYPILQAYAEGNVIECRTKPSTMKGADTPNDWTEIKKIAFWNNTEYRIKQEPKYRPFEDAEECWDEMQKHEPLGWLKMKSNDEEKGFLFVRGIHKYIKDNSNTCDICIDDDWESSIYIFGEYTFADGTPFGVKVEE